MFDTSKKNYLEKYRLAVKSVLKILLIREVLNQKVPSNFGDFGQFLVAFGE